MQNIVQQGFLIVVIPFLDIKKVTESHGDEIRHALLDVTNSGWYLRGEATERFERQYAAYIGTRHAIGCANGLDALRLIFRAYIELGVMRRGDEVIVPANTYIASVLAITDNGLVPVFVEPDVQTLNLDWRLVEKHLTERTRAVMLVHLFGRCAYTEQVADVCRRYGLKIIEDNAQAHGCIYGCGQARGHKRGKQSGVRTGALGDAAGHSFYPGKNLGALGDAGCVTTDDDELADIVRALGNYGSSGKYIFPYQGLNSRLDEIQAAVLSVKLLYLDEDNAKRYRIAQYYYAHVDNCLLPPLMPEGANVFHLFPIFCKNQEERDTLCHHLSSCGVQTLIHYPVPPHKQACYKAWNGLSLPITERMAQTELSLPISPVMTLEDAAEVVRNIVV